MSVIPITTTVDQEVHEWYQDNKGTVKWADLIRVGYQSVLEHGIDITRQKDDPSELKRRMKFFIDRTHTQREELKEAKELNEILQNKLADKKKRNR